MKQPRVIVADTAKHFARICKSNGWATSEIYYVNYLDVGSRLVGYYADEIYPPEYSEYGLKRHVSFGDDESEGFRMGDEPYFVCPECDDQVDDYDYFAGIWSFYCHNCGVEYEVTEEDDEPALNSGESEGAC